MPKVKPYTDGYLRMYNLKLHHLLQLRDLYNQQLLNVNNFLEEKGNTEHYPVCVINEYQSYKQEFHDKLKELEIEINQLEVFANSLRVIDNNAD